MDRSLGADLWLGAAVADTPRGCLHRQIHAADQEAGGQRVPRAGDVDDRPLAPPQPVIGTEPGTNACTGAPGFLP